MKQMRDMQEKEKLLIALPCLIPSGGINVVVNLVEVLQKIGYQIDIVSKEEGSMRSSFEKLGIRVEIRSNVIEGDYIASVLKKYNQVIVNTLQMCSMIYKLNGTSMEVKWWIHEPPAFFKDLSSTVPQKFWDELKENVEVYSAGNLVHDYIFKTYGKESFVLNFGVTDYAGMLGKLKSDIVSKDKITFLLPSITFQWIKGQDLLALAIAGLPEEYQKKTEFIFIGCPLEGAEDFYKITSTLAMERDNVRIMGIIERVSLLALMKEVDCIVAPSREDATNSCIVEGLMLSKLCICSDMTGVSHYMEDCVNGFVFPSCNVDELRARIMLIVDNFERLKMIAQNGRRVYEENFAMDVFERNVRKYWAKEVK